jgi:hypothetical protein
LLPVAEVTAKLEALDVETAVVNARLRSNPVAEPVASYRHTRNSPKEPRPYGRRATRDPEALGLSLSRLPARYGQDPVSPPHEVVREADIRPNGKAIPVPALQHDYYGRVLTINPTFEDCEVVTERVSFRPGQSEAPLASVRSSQFAANSQSFFSVCRRFP